MPANLGTFLRLGIALNRLLEAKASSGTDFSLRLTSSWCSHEPLIVAELIYRHQGELIKCPEPVKSYEMAKVLEQVADIVEGKAGCP